jgi:hypothetical protein
MGLLPEKASTRERYVIRVRGEIDPTHGFIVADKLHLSHMAAGDIIHILSP